MHDPLGGSNHELPRVDPAQRLHPGTMDYEWNSRPAVAARTCCIGLILNNGLTNHFIFEFASIRIQQIFNGIINNLINRYVF